MVLGGFGSFWVVLGRFGWFWVVPCFSNYAEFTHKLFIPNPCFTCSQCLLGGQSLGAAYSPSQGFKITYNYFVASKKTTGSLPTTDALCNTPAGTSIMSPG